jgi:hypothetical protein
MVFEIIKGQTCTPDKGPDCADVRKNLGALVWIMILDVRIECFPLFFVEIIRVTSFFRLSR